jgi:hypothetical protein
MSDAPERTVEQITADTCAEIDAIFARFRADLMPPSDRPPCRGAGVSAGGGFGRW